MTFAAAAFDVATFDTMDCPQVRTLEQELSHQPPHLLYCWSLAKFSLTTTLELRISGSDYALNVVFLCI